MFANKFVCFVFIAFFTFCLLAGIIYADKQDHTNLSLSEKKKIILKLLSQTENINNIFIDWSTKITTHPHYENNKQKAIEYAKKISSPPGDVHRELYQRILQKNIQRQLHPTIKIRRYILLLGDNRYHKFLQHVGDVDFNNMVHYKNYGFSDSPNGHLVFEIKKDKVDFKATHLNIFRIEKYLYTFLHSLKDVQIHMKGNVVSKITMDLPGKAVVIKYNRPDITYPTEIFYHSKSKNYKSAYLYKKFKNIENNFIPIKFVREYSMKDRWRAIEEWVARTIEHYNNVTMNDLDYTVPNGYEVRNYHSDDFYIEIPGKKFVNVLEWIEKNKSF